MRGSLLELIIEKLEEATKASSKLKAEIDSLKASEFNKGKEAGKKAPAGEPSVTGRPGANLSYSLAQIDAMPTSEWMSLGDKSTRDQILERAHEAARR